MTALASDGVLLVLLAFCRVGACFLVLPGLSSSRVPVQVRLLLVISITIAMLGQIWPMLATADITQPSLLARLMVSETAIGLFIGLCVRFYLLALGFMATAMGTVIGFGNLMGPGFEETEPQAALGTLLTMAALLLLFIFDFHHAVIHSLISSYKVVPVSGSFQTETYLANLTDTLKEAFLSGSAPWAAHFIAYSLVVNLMIGILNKLTPQIPIYFISLPFLIFGGLLLLYFAVPTFPEASLLTGSLNSRCFAEMTGPRSAKKLKRLVLAQSVAESLAKSHVGQLVSQGFQNLKTKLETAREPRLRRQKTSLLFSDLHLQPYQ